MRNLLLGLVLGLFCFQGPAFSAEEGAQENPLLGSNFSIGTYLDINLASGFTGGGLSTNNHIGWGLGVLPEYYFSPNVGLLFGGMLQSRGAGITGGGSAKGFFLDVPAGLAFRYSSSMIGANNKNVVSLGPYFSLPLGDLKNGGAVIASTKSSFGLYFMAKTMFPVGESLGLGFNTWIRYGLSGALQGGLADKLLEISLGFSVDF